MSGSDHISVLSRFPAEIAGLRWVPLGSGGGFSGASVWRGESPTGEPLFSLKAWPTGTTADRLREVHRVMACAALPFVPAVGFTAAGATTITLGGRVWDLTAWMPGSADFSAHPSDARLAAAMAALAELHRAWRPATPQFGVCPGVARRMEVIGRVLMTGVPAAPANGHTRRAVSLLPAFAARAANALRPWADTPLPLQLCLRDIWHDHVLFTGDRVTGIIDYGAVNLDHPAVDLARLLGDLVGTDADRLRSGVEMYRTAGGIAEADPNFVLALAHAGLVGSVLHWLDRFAAGVTITPAATDRFRTLVARLEARSAAG